MNRAEFMAALEAQLRDITTEERDEALKFYNEYLDEAGPENEAAVLAELGSPQKVACIIRANCGFGVPAVRDAAEKSTAPEKPEQAPVPELTLDGPDWQASQAPAQETERSWAEGQRADEEAPDGFPNAQAADGAQHGPAYAYSYPQDGAQRENGGRSASNRTLWVILLILTCPIWIGLIGGLFGGVVGIVGGLCGIAFAGFATMIAGVAAFGGGVGLAAHIRSQWYPDDGSQPAVHLHRRAAGRGYGMGRGQGRSGALPCRRFAVPHPVWESEVRRR